MSKGKWRARYFLITCSEVKFHCSCFLFCFCFFHKTNVIERARNLMRFFCETRLRTGSPDPLNRWTYFAVQWRVWTRSSLGLMTISGRHLNNKTYCYQYYKNIFSSFVESQKNHTVEQCIATTETRNSLDSLLKNSFVDDDCYSTTI